MATNRRRSQRSTSRGLRTTAVKVSQQGTATTAPEATGGEDVVNWGMEYGYIVKDLRQLAIVSAGLFALLLIVGWIF